MFGCLRQQGSTESTDNLMTNPKALCSTTATHTANNINMTTLQIPTAYDPRRYSKPNISQGNVIFPKVANFHRSRSWSSGKEAQCSSPGEKFLLNMPTPATNKDGYATLPGVENIDAFLLVLRFYGFDLWMNRYAETGKQLRKRNFLTKLFYFVALFLINCQMIVHLTTTGYIIMTKKKNFNSFLDDLRTFILKFTMTFAVDLWFFWSRRQAAMTHLVVINYLRANKAQVLRHIALTWMAIMLVGTIVHWAISQYWLSSMTIQDQSRWLSIISCATETPWLHDKFDRVTIAILRAIATLDSFIYRMYIYGSRFAVMCAYCLLSILLSKCIEQVNDILTYHLDNEYHYHHHYCRRARERRRYMFGRYSHQEDVKFNIELFKRQFTIVYGMHQEIEHCFGPLNFLWFGSLFVVSCVDIFFIASNAGTEWFHVWSVLEFSSMVLLWAPHFGVAYCAGRVSIQARQMRLHLKELCRQDDEIRELVISPTFFPRIKPTLNGIVSLDIGFLLSFVVTLVTFSVMLIQLNPDAKKPACVPICIVWNTTSTNCTVDDN